MEINVQDAKSQLSKLLAAVEQGGTVTICRNGKPVADLRPHVPSTCRAPGWGSAVHMRPEGTDDDPNYDPTIPPTDEQTMRDWGL